MAVDIKAQMEKLFAATEEKTSRYQELLPNTGDISLVVLKGHLIIEEMLFAIAINHCTAPDEFRKAKLTFAQLLHVVRAMLKLPIGHRAWEAIGLLNNIRNTLVHNLSPQEIDTKISALYRKCVIDIDDPPLPDGYVHATELSDMAVRAISFIIGVLSVLDPVSALIEQNLQFGTSAERT